MSRECVVATESLLLGTDGTMHLLLARIVDGVFMASEIVRAGEDGIAWFAGRRVDSLAFVRSSLRVSLRLRSHPIILSAASDRC